MTIVHVHVQKHAIIMIIVPNKFFLYKFMSKNLVITKYITKKHIITVVYPETW